MKRLSCGDGRGAGHPAPDKVKAAHSPLAAVIAVRDNSAQTDPSIPDCDIFIHDRETAYYVCAAGHGHAVCNDENRMTYM